MKFLVTWNWSCDCTKEAWERLVKEPATKIKFVYPLHVIVGANTGFAVVEEDSIENMAKTAEAWTDLMTFEISPIMDAREVAKLRSSK
jgi:hypothetical protein